MRYNHKKIEKKWQARWFKEKIYEPDFTPRQARGKKPFYNLMMFPYPSAEGLHIGAVRTFSGVDIYGRMKRMQGYDLFEPIGLDGFGIHSENYALKIGKHPIQHAKDSEKNFYRQLNMMGNGFSWREKLETYDPKYYKWTQWIFVQLFKRGLAYRKKSPVNWCPSCMTVLADEQVLQGECERCGTKVIKKDLEQWFFKITNYAERLLKNLEKLDWSESVKIAQKNWIGKNEGALIDFEVAGSVAHSYVLLHGYSGSPSESFFPWLKKELESRGAKVYVPRLPDSNDPRVYDQVSKILKSVSFDKNTVLVGHSLGGVVALKVLERLEKPIRKTVLVASFSENKFITEPFEAHTFDWKFDVKKIKANAGEIHILRDTTDDTVPSYQADSLQRLFGGSIFDFVASEQHATGQKEKEILRHCLDSIQVFTTRPDTLFGATYLVLAPEHKLISKIKDFIPSAVEGQISNIKEVENYIKIARAKTDEERIAEGKEKTGVELRGIVAINPANRDRIPVWVADYVFGHVGTGAIMAVPAHDQRDFEFAKKFNLPIRIVVCPHYPAKTCPVLDFAYLGSGHLVASGKFDGMDSEKAKWEITKFFGGERKINYRLRDWLVSRQRYWGPPIPMIFCNNCKKSLENLKLKMQNSKLLKKFSKGELENSGWVAASEKDLPVKLPYVKNFRPTGTGTGPLGSVKSFYEVNCPNCGGKARRETDVSDAFLDSAWYYLGYLILGNKKPKIKNQKFIFDRALLRKWLPVNMYIGGAEHSVLHLLYSRFLAMALHDMGILNFSAEGGPASGREEPFKIFRAHGLITKDGAKMSKSKGNVVNPDEYFKIYGADVMRMYLAFMAPLYQSGDFRDEGIAGMTRFLNRVFNLTSNFQNLSPRQIPGLRPSEAKTFASDPISNKIPNTKNPIQKKIHQTIKKVTEDIEGLEYNTAISALMTLLNEFEANPSEVTTNDLKIFLKLLAPFAPYISEELWHKLAAGDLREGVSVHKSPWPKYDPKVIEEDNVTIVIQINGKMRDKFETKKDLPESEIQRIVFSREKIKNIVGDKPKTKKFIYVKNRLANIVS